MYKNARKSGFKMKLFLYTLTANPFLWYKSHKSEFFILVILVKVSISVCYWFTYRMGFYVVQVGTQ